MLEKKISTITSGKRPLGYFEREIHTWWSDTREVCPCESSSL
jgi:hypothetical protein